MNRIKNLRRFALLTIAIVGSLTLAACNGDATPYGDISEDKVYLTLGDYKVNEKELYDQFRIQGSSILTNEIEKIIFKDYIDKAVSQLEGKGDDAQDTLDYFYETINSAIFNRTDKDDLQDLYDNKNDLYVRSIEQFVDSLYLLDNSMDIDAVKTALLELPTPFSGYETIPVLVDTYKLSVGERIYAKEQLAKAVDDEDDDNYIKDADLVSYYKNNVEGRYDVNALIVRFINLNEANAALYEVGLKSDSKGLWYEIPDIRVSDPANPSYVDLTDDVTYEHVIDILNDLNLLGKMGDDYADRSKISTADYEDYYRAYTISRENNYADTPLEDDEVKAKFVEIYNLLNPTNPVSIDNEGNVVGNENFSTTYTYDDLTALNASLRTHVYTTLTAETKIEDENTEKAYSSRTQTFGEYRYLVYKLDDNSADDEGILVEDPDDEDAEIFSDTEAAKAAKADAKVKVFDNKLTSSYINSQVSEKYGDAKVDIYDRLLRILYKQSNSYEGTEKNQAGSVIATVNGTDVTVRDFYTEVEKSYGINLSLDIIINKFLADNEEYAITDDEYDDYKTQFEDIITAFGANSYSSYPASMGREAFLLVAFGATSNEEAIDQLYVYPELRDRYLNDYEAHFSNANHSIYEKFAELAALQAENEKAINVSHLLVYFDNDADGTPDDPSEYLATLDATAKAEIMTGLSHLLQGYTDGEGVYHEGIYDKLGEYTDFASGLTDIADEFNNSGRILRGSFLEKDENNDIISYKDIQPELYWAEYRQLGFHLKFESISSEITNSSNFITNNSVLDKVFYNRAIDIFDILADTPDDDSKFPYLDFYDAIEFGTGITEDDLAMVESDFGWHFILATSVGETESAKYAASDDKDGDYTNDEYDVNAYNEDSDMLTASQIEYYLTLNATDEGAPLPRDVEDTVTAYLSPILAKYNGSNATYMKRELIFRLVSDAVFADSEDAARLETIKSINIRQFNSYMLSDKGVYDANYDALYGTWFDILES